MKNSESIDFPSLSSGFSNLTSYFSDVTVFKIYQILIFLIVTNQFFMNKKPNRFPTVFESTLNTPFDELV
jgi:hypothetical protein